MTLVPTGMWLNIPVLLVPSARDKERRRSCHDQITGPAAIAGGVGHERGADHFGDDRHGQAGPGDQRATGGNSTGHVKLLAGRGPRRLINGSTPRVEGPERPSQTGATGVSIIVFYGGIKMDSIDRSDGSMPYSPESLQAFVEAAALGSFSAAARRLGKTQSTVSTAIAPLEADLGVSLFDRSGRYPRLTEAGRQVLGHAQEILAADARLQQLSVRLSAPVEPRLTVV